MGTANFAVQCCAQLQQALLPLTGSCCSGTTPRIMWAYIMLSRYDRLQLLHVGMQ